MKLRFGSEFTQKSAALAGAEAAHQQSSSATINVPCPVENAPVEDAADADPQALTDWGISAVYLATEPLAHTRA